MQKNKGFTLIELIITIALIALVGTIITINLVSLNKKQTDKEISRKESILKGAAEAYLDVTKQNGCVEINTLVQNGYINEDLVKDFNGQYIGITKNPSGDVIFNTYETSAECKNSFKTYTVSLNPNGGENPNTSIEVMYSYSYGTLYTLPTPTRNGYTFSGWYTKKNGGELIDNDTKVTVPSNHTLYAHWQANKYTITFDGNGGTLSTQTKEFTFGTSYGTLPTPTRNGYTFLGWYTKKNGGELIDKDTKVTVPSNTTLFAQWQANNYTITFDGNGGTVSTQTKELTFGTSFGDLPTVSRNGYVFKGWFTSKSGGTLVTKDSLFNDLSNTTLFAQWKDNTPPTCGKVSEVFDSWSNEDRTVEIECLDKESGCKYDKYVYSSVNDEVVDKKVIRIEDNEGNYTNCFVDVKVDKKKPYTPIVSEIDFDSSTNIESATITCDNNDLEYTGNRECTIEKTKKHSGRWRLYYYLDGDIPWPNSDEECFYSKNKDNWYIGCGGFGNTLYFKNSDEAGNESGILTVKIK